MNIFRLRKMLLFYEELYRLIKSSLGIVEAFDNLSDNFYDAKLREMLKYIKNSLSRGNDLSSALKVFNNFFLPWQIAVISSSQKAGRLKEGLEDIIAILKTDYNFYKKIIIGLIYPFLLLNAAIFLFPLANFYTHKSGATYFSQVFKMCLLIYGGGGLLYYLHYSFKKDPLKKFYDKAILKIPFIGNLISKLVAIRFLNCLNILCKSGVGVVLGWQEASFHCENNYFKQKLSSGLDILKNGGCLSEAMRKSKVFPKKILSFISSTEASGEIPSMLENVSGYCQEEVGAVLNILSLVIPIFFYLIIAAYIGIKVITFYSHYFNTIFSY